MTKLEAVRMKVIEAVPSIMELKFGCRYTLNGQGGIYVVDGSNYIVNKAAKNVRIISICNHPPKTACCGIYQDQNDESKQYRINEILGRDIRLSDVLAMVEKLEGDRPERVDEELTGLYGTEDWYGSFVQEIVMGWNFLKDNINYQTPEFIDFLYSILCE